MVVSAPAAARSSLAADPRTLSIARGQVRKLVVEDPQAAPNLSSPGVRGATRLGPGVPAAAAAPGINPDPAWDYRRIGLPEGWKTTAGSRRVTVVVADTGLGFTHSELAPPGSTWSR